MKINILIYINKHFHSELALSAGVPLSVKNQQLLDISMHS